MVQQSVMQSAIMSQKFVVGEGYHVAEASSTNSAPLPKKLYITPETEEAGAPNLKFTKSTSTSLLSTF